MNKEELEFKINQIVYKKIFNDNDCDKILEFYKKLEFYDSNVLSYDSTYKSFNQSKVDSKIRLSKERVLSYSDSNWIKEKIHPYMKEINDNFFKLPSLSFGTFNLLEYGINGEFKWHADQGTSGRTSLRRISLIFFLSNRDEYEGGQLEFMPKLKEPIKMEKGYMVAFPSHKIHRVTQIKSGIRRTMVNWVYEYRE